jgi:hypothetical protein
MKENNVQAVAYHVFRMTSTPDEQITNITNTLTKASFDSNKDKLAISATTGICEGERTRKCDNPTNHTNTERAANLHSLLTKLDKNGYSPIVYASPKTWNSYYTQKDHDFSKFHYGLLIGETDRSLNYLKIGRMRAKTILIGITPLKEE